MELFKTFYQWNYIITGIVERCCCHNRFLEKAIQGVSRTWDDSWTDRDVQIPSTWKATPWTRFEWRSYGEVCPVTEKEEEVASGLCLQSALLSGFYALHNTKLLMQQRPEMWPSSGEVKQAFLRHSIHERYINVTTLIWGNKGVYIKLFYWWI